ncbi:MAG TPA: dockerin type I repeat-containing protein [Oscillospiraceae bacterium]|nr:dockerin type I repeat-containing protein [Oscillospiraceae bacterium]
MVADTYTIVILGDISGDSAIDAADQFYLNLHLNGHTEIDGAYLAACDVSGDGAVNKNDYNILKRWALGDFS